MEEFINWLNQELNKRGWPPSELQRRAKLGNSTLTRILSGDREPGADVCVAIALALGEPPERVFRIAGLLPPLPGGENEKSIGEAMDLFKRLPLAKRRDVLGYAYWRFRQPEPSKDNTGDDQDDLGPNTLGRKAPGKA